MMIYPSEDWSVFQQIFAEHWDAFAHAHPRYETPYYAGLVAKMLACGNPEQMVVYRSAADNLFIPKTHYNALISLSSSGALPWYPPSFSINLDWWHWYASS